MTLMFDIFLKLDQEEADFSTMLMLWIIRANGELDFACASTSRFEPDHLDNKQVWGQKHAIPHELGTTCQREKVA